MKISKTKNATRNDNKSTVIYITEFEFTTRDPEQTALVFADILHAATFYIRQFQSLSYLHFSPEIERRILQPQSL